MTRNPFPDDADRSAIWEMLMPRDFEAFAAQDWSRIEPDFDKGRFLGIHAHFSANEDEWDAAFPSWEIYRDEWLRQARESARFGYARPLPEQLLEAATLDRIDINGDVAVAHKKFNGSIERADGSSEVLSWQTLYFCRKEGGRWLITGFVGYMKHGR